MPVAVATLGFVVLVLAVLVVGLLRSHAEILRRLHELGAGVYDDGDGATTRSEPEIRTQAGVPEPRQQSTAVHDVVGTTANGGQRSVRVAGTGHATLLAFLSSGCGTCAEFWSAFASGEADRLPGGDTRLVIVTKGAEAESTSAVRELAPPGVHTLMSSDAYENYGVPVSPYFILVDGTHDQVIGEGAAASWPQVRNLLGQAAADAGLAVDAPSHDASARRTARDTGRAREARADEELLAAGITPGHESLYPASQETEHDPDRS